MVLYLYMYFNELFYCEILHCFMWNICPGDDYDLYFTDDEEHRYQLFPRSCRIIVTIKWNYHNLLRVSSF